MDELPASVTWARSFGHRRAHAFADIDLSAEFVGIESVSGCGKFTVAKLITVSAEYPNQCRACRRAPQQTSGVSDTPSLAPDVVQPGQSG